MRRPFFARSLTAVLFAAMLSVLALAHQPAYAEAFAVDTIDDDPTKMVCTAAANDCSLRGAITAANQTTDVDVIDLQNGATYTLDEPSTNEDYNLDGDLDILEPMTINGHNATIDANGISRAIELYPANLVPGSVTLNNMTITGGNEFDGGGGISAEGGSLILQNVTVTDNHATITGGGLRIESDGNLSITSSTFTGNTAGYGGGAIFSQDSEGSRTITGSTFSGNSTTIDGTGGAITMGLARDGLQITDTTITGNTATVTCLGGTFRCGQGGGGLFVPAETLQLTGGEVTNNATNGDGGGMLLFGEGIIDGTLVAGNTAGARGGGVSASEFEITDAEISGNDAANGGGLDTTDGQVSGSTISDNIATESGGGIASIGALQISQTAIYGNAAVLIGGGVAFSGDSPSIANSTISGNDAATGGGIGKGLPLDSSGPFEQPNGAQAAGPLTVTFSTIASNTALNGANVFREAALGPINLRGSIVADADLGPNCSGGLASQGHNIEDADTCGLTDPSDATDTEPSLATLADNGGDTMTHALQPGSPAVDFVKIGCPPPTEDQRGAIAPRPQGTACDAGAFESSFTATGTPTPTAGPSATPTATPVVTGTATPTGAATPTPSGSPTGNERLWGDVDCDGSVTTRDNQAELRFVLQQNALSQTPPCAAIGSDVTVSGTTRKWGDEDCDGTVTTRDNQSKLRFVLQQIPLSQTEPCPDVGAAVVVTILV